MLKVLSESRKLLHVQKLIINNSNTSGKGFQGFRGQGEKLKNIEIFFISWMH